MKHLGNLALFGLFTALLVLPLVGFGFLEYADSPVGPAPTNTNVLPASDLRPLLDAEEASESTETTAQNL